LPCVLITGADGFIGKSLCAEMVSRGWEVRASVRLGEKIKSLPEKIEVIETGSVYADTDWGKALANVESVVHLAGRVHVMADSSSDPLSEYRIVNTAGTEKLARAASSSGVRRFVFMSTVKVNGEGRAILYNENDIPDPRDPYSISKWEAEKILMEVSHKTGMEVVIIRVPLVYGPGVKANFLKLLKMVDKGIPIPFKGINNKRSMIYLYNLTDLIIACIKHPDAAGKTYFASDGEDISTPELIRRMADALGKKSRLFGIPLPLMKTLGSLASYNNEIERLTGSLAVDSSRVRKELNWEPRFTLDQGLKETARWYKEEFHAKAQRR
jgi:nucleoside-diphosphate-sugar epimerase